MANQSAEGAMAKQQPKPPVSHIITERRHNSKKG